MWEQTIYEWLPFVVVTAALTLAVAMFVRFRIQHRILQDEETLAERRQVRLKSIQQEAGVALPSTGSSDEPLLPGLTRIPTMEPALAEHPAPEPGQAASSAPPCHTPNPTERDPSTIQFLHQIRYFEEQFQAELPLPEKRVVDSVLEDSLNYDKSFATWWEQARVQWSDRDFVQYVDALHPSLPQSSA